MTNPVLILPRAWWQKYAMRSLVLIFLLLLVLSCSGPLTDPQQIVDKSIEVHGGEKYAHSTLSFDFRNRHYVAMTDDGKFSYERIFKDSTSTIHDFLTNDGFVREINGQQQVLPDSMVKKYTSSVNSVIYFAQLPYRLNDPSVNKKLMGTTILEGQPYYKVEITFGEEGGGEGYSDTFYYWIHQETFVMDYLAYFFEEDKMWDIRFRKAFNRRKVNGILFQDYINFKPKASDAPFKDSESLYASGQFEELSRIVLENAGVN